MEDTYIQLVAGMAYALPCVFGIVEFFKSVFSLDGKGVTVMSFFVGIVSGGAVFAQFLLPDIGQYVSGGFFVLSAGLVASGFYKFANARWPKAE